MINNRAYFVRQLLRDHQLDALVFFNTVNLRYLCGFSGSDGALVVTAESDCFLSDSRYSVQAGKEVVADRLTEYKVKADGVIEILVGLGARRIGFEAETLAYAMVERLREKSGRERQWLPLGKELLSLRGIKDSAEVKILEEAAGLNAMAFEEILPLIRPGAVERDIALALEMVLRRLGGEERAFDFIVASGVRGAMPHGVASDKVITVGELVTVDFGTRRHGYHSDETVTIAVGDIEPRMREVFDVVLTAHDLAIMQVRPGISLRDLDQVARNYIWEQGYGEYFGHGLGHGLGLEVHEFPTVSPRSEDIAGEGMVFTIEPGIYIPDLGGVRIEDTVLVTADGCRSLTSIPKTFRTVTT
jgi:Xaa-Pro aminopeptidase